MRRLNRLTVAGVTSVACALGFWAFALPASASVGADPVPVTSAATVQSQPQAATPTAGEITVQAAKKKKDPCEAGAALDSESGKWRATVSCDDWTAVLPGTYDSREAAMDESEGWVRGVNQVVDGPGCNEPFVLC
jgi:hypothetical protein